MGRSSIRSTHLNDSWFNLLNDQENLILQKYLEPTQIVNSQPNQFH